MNGILTNVVISEERRWLYGRGLVTRSTLDRIPVEATFTIIIVVGFVANETGLGECEKQTTFLRSVIKVRVEITANHLGYFEFRLCQLARPAAKATKACFDKHVLRLADGSGTQYKLGTRKGIIAVKLRLPRGVRCKRCVIQWKYHAGQCCGPAADLGPGGGRGGGGGGGGGGVGGRGGGIGCLGA